MKNKFINPETGLLRAGWRILAFFVLFIAITIPVMMGIRELLGGLRAGSNLQFTILAVTATLAVFIARRFFDKKPIIDLGLSWDNYAFADVVSGIVISALIMVGTYTLMLSQGYIVFDGFTWWTDEGTATATFKMAALAVAGAVFYQLILVAWWEELVFRGYILRNTIDGLGLKWAIIVTSLGFGLGHAFNPEGSLLGILLIVLITPQLIYAYVKTGQLWLPMGLHLGWNFFQASVFGFPSSGQASPSLIAQHPVGPEWLSGGTFGAEGSVMILPFTFLSYALIHLWVRRTRQPEQRFFASMI